MRPSHAVPEGRECMQISFIGAGKVGVSLGRYFKEKGRNIGGYYSRSPESAAWAADFTGTQQYHSLKEVIGSSDMIFLTVPDDAIACVWEEMRPFVSEKIIAHCSGIHSSSIFSDIGRTKSIAYSVHPLCAISDKESSWKKLETTLFTVEGGEGDCRQIADWFREMGNKVRVIAQADKYKYHAAASLASNHMTAVFYLAQKLFLECGFSEEEARYELYQLAAGNLENIKAQGCIAALTGPIERGDAATVEKHLKVLNEKEKKTYCQLAYWLTEISEKKHTERNYQSVRELILSETEK